MLKNKARKFRPGVATRLNGQKRQALIGLPNEDLKACFTDFGTQERFSATCAESVP